MKIIKYSAILFLGIICFITGRSLLYDTMPNYHPSLLDKPGKSQASLVIGKLRQLAMQSKPDQQRLIYTALTAYFRTLRNNLVNEADV